MYNLKGYTICLSSGIPDAESRVLNKNLETALKYSTLFNYYFKTTELFDGVAHYPVEDFF